MKILFALVCVLFSHSVFAQSATLSGRHVYILYPGINSIWGSYMTVVERTSMDGDGSFNYDLMLPESTVDWSPQQGIDKDEVRLDEEGGLYVDAKFERPQSLVVVGFKTSAENGKAVLKMEAPFDIQQFQIMAAVGKLELDAPNFEKDGPINFTGREYDRWTLKDVKVGQVITATVLDVPEGRRDYAMVATVFGLILFLLCFVLAWRSRPQKDNTSGSASEFEAQPSS